MWWNWKPIIFLHTREAAEHVNFPAIVAKNQFECYRPVRWIMCWQFWGRLRSRGILRIKICLIFLIRLLMGTWTMPERIFKNGWVVLGLVCWNCFWPNGSSRNDLAKCDIFWFYFTKKKSLGVKTAVRNIYLDLILKIEKIRIWLWRRRRWTVIEADGEEEGNNERKVIV